MAMDYAAQPTGMPEQTQEKTEQARRAVLARLEQARSAVTEKSREAARYANQRVHDNPWTSVGIAFAAGTIFGALIALAAHSQRR